jgi:hypothetical protein
VYLNSLKFWYTFQNISADRGNNHFYLTDDILTPDKYDITIPDGLYSVDTLETCIQNELVNLGLSNKAVSISGDLSTGKVFFALESGFQVYMKSGSPYVLLGATLNQKIPSAGLTTGQYGEYAPNEAQFSSLSSVNVHCSLVTQSIVNGARSNVISSVAPDVTVGSQQIYEPTHLVKCPADNLLGAQINEITVSLTDQNNNPINTAGENWSMTIVVEYLIKDDA